MPAVTKVAIAVVESSGHVLVGIRPSDVPLAVLSEFPGGKCEADETPKSCVVRECREETGLMVVPRDHLTSVRHSYDHGEVELHFWRCALTPDLPELADAAGVYEWVPVSDLTQREFPEANAKILEILTGQPVNSQSS